MRVLLLASLVLLAACVHSASTPTPAPAAAAPPPVAKPAPAGPPVARATDFTETLFGTTVTDPYRWMEGTENAELDTWLRAQGDFTRAALDKLKGRNALLARLEALGGATGLPGAVTMAGGRLFYTYLAPGAEVATLMVRDHGVERLLVDPAKLGDAAHHAALNAFAPSRDGTFVAYDVSLGGGEVSTIHVLDVATGKDLPDALERIWGEFAATWLPDGKSFLYVQMAPPQRDVDVMLNMQLRLHVLGQPIERDVAVMGSGLGDAFKLAPNEFPTVQVSPAGDWLLAFASGARSETRLAVARLADLDRSGKGKTPWKTVCEYSDGVEGAVAHGDRVYLASYQGASNRKLISVPLAKPELGKARLEVPEDPTQPLVSYADTKDALYLHKQFNGLSHLYRWPWKGAATELTLPFAGAIDQVVTDAQGEKAIVAIESWTQPTRYFEWDPRKGKFQPTGLDVVSNADFRGVKTEEVEATSEDGTKVPLSLIYREGLARDGANPAIVYGYGGYGISMTPAFSPAWLAWLERGGVYAICHVRGGGEKGHQWQVDGALGKKMNGVHDFEACARYLAEQKLSSAAHTFANAGSMGGVLLGRAITDQPGLFAAAAIQVGVVDPVRLGAAENGANQFAEVGDPGTEAGFHTTYEMSPYAHVSAQAYPATLFTVGLNDKRVAPWMSAKMAARMQKETTSGKPVLVRVDADAGHGVGSTRSQAFELRADIWSFFLAASSDPDFVTTP